MINIFIIISEMSKGEYGGMESHAFAMADYFRQRSGCEVAVVVAKNQRYSRLETFLQRRQIPLLKWIDLDFKKTKKTFLELIPQNSSIFFNSPLSYPLFAPLRRNGRHLKLFVRSGGNDLGYHIPLFQDPRFSLTRILRNIGLNPPRLKYHQIKKVESINRYVDRLIVNSHYSKERALSLGIISKKIVVAPGGTPVPELSKQNRRESKELIIINVSRLVPFKGTQFTLQAFHYASLRADRPIRMIIVGEGRCQGELEQFVAEQKIQRVDFTGSLSYPDALNYYRQADVYLHMPTISVIKDGRFLYEHTETMGRSLCEASAFGLPIVCADIGGVREVVSHGENGFLVPEKDYVQAGKRLLELQDPALRERLGDQGRALSEKKYSWPIVFSIYEKLGIRGQS